MFGSDRLFTALNISAITSLVGTYLAKPAIFPAHIIPDAYTGTEVINYYLVSPYDATIGYAEYVYNVNCRSAVELTSKTIAKAVIDNLNDTAITGGRLYCRLLPGLPPTDKDDTYNTPVEVKIKSV